MFVRDIGTCVQVHTVSQPRENLDKSEIFPSVTCKPVRFCRPTYDDENTFCHPWVHFNLRIVDAQITSSAK